MDCTHNAGSCQSPYDRWIALAAVQQERHPGFNDAIQAEADRAGVAVVRAELPEWCRVAWCPADGGTIALELDVPDDEAARAIYAIIRTVGML